MIVSMFGLHRTADDRVFYYTYTSNHWHQFRALDGEGIEVRWLGGVEWVDERGRRYLQFDLLPFPVLAAYAKATQKKWCR